MIKEESLFVILAEILEEQQNLLRAISAKKYTTSIISLEGGTIGGHTRHIIEFLEILLASLDKNNLNYDDRKRDYQIQTDTDFAKQTIVAVINQLDRPNKSLKLQQIVDGEELLIDTNYNRELLYNLEHCIHHQALIKVAVLQNDAITIDANFGVARSTIEYRKQCAQ